MSCKDNCNYLKLKKIAHTFYSKKVINYFIKSLHYNTLKQFNHKKSLRTK